MQFGKLKSDKCFEWTIKFEIKKNSKQWIFLKNVQNPLTASFFAVLIIRKKPLKAGCIAFQCRL